MQRLSFSMLIVGAVLTGACSSVQAQTSEGSSAQSSLGVANDCSETGVNYEERHGLTKEEQLEAMNQALFNSLSRFDACQDQKASDSAGGGAAGGAGGGMDGVGTAAGGGSATASSDISGDEPSETKQNNSDSLGAAIKASDMKSVSASGGPEAASSASDNGKIPDDIPPSDNDGVLEAQIRQAAMNEPDPEVRNQLWNEYRKYKGLPEKQ